MPGPHLHSAGCTFRAVRGHIGGRADTRRCASQISRFARVRRISAAQPGRVQKATPPVPPVPVPSRNAVYMLGPRQRRVLTPGGGGRGGVPGCEGWFQAAGAPSVLGSVRSGGQADTRVFTVLPTHGFAGLTHAFCYPSYPIRAALGLAPSRAPICTSTIHIRIIKLLREAACPEATDPHRTTSTRGVT